MRRIVLPAAGRDLSAFRLEGWLDGCAVSASWDGHLLTVADRLDARVALAQAVDSIYRNAGLEPDDCALSLTASAVEYRSGTEAKKLL
jgi:hypothetical protein